MRQRTSDEAQAKMKLELKKTIDVLKHLKRKVGDGFYDEEYALLLEEVDELP
jgi:hypothetical protein